MANLPHTLRESVSFERLADLRVRYFSAPRTEADITPALISLSWDEDKQLSARQFTVVLDNWNGVTRRVVRGGVVLINYRAGNVWEEWFRGTVLRDSSEHDATTAQKTLTVLDPLRVLGRTKSRWVFRAGRTATASIRSTLERLGIPVGHLDDSRVELPAITYNGTLFDAFQTLLKRTKDKGGPRLTCEMVGSRFYLVRYEDPTWRWDLDEVIARISRDISIEDTADRLVLRTKQTIKIGKRKRTRINTAVASANRATLLRSGLIVVTEDTADDSKKPKGRAAAERKLKDKMKPTETLTVEVPLAALTLRRNQPVSIDTMDAVTGAQGRYYVSALSGQCSADGASMTLTLTRRPTFITEIPPSNTVGAGRSEAPGSADGTTVEDAPERWPGNSASKTLKAKWMAAKAEEKGLPAVLPVMAALGESNMDQYVVNPTSGATGLFQIIRRFHPGVDPTDPEEALNWFINTALHPEKRRYVTSRGLTLKQVLAQGEAGYGTWISRDIEGSDASGSYYQGFLKEAKELIG